MNLSWRDATQPLPIIELAVLCHVQPVRVPPWKRRLRRWGWALLAALPLFLFAVGIPLIGGR